MGVKSLDIAATHPPPPNLLPPGEGELLRPTFCKVSMGHDTISYFRVFHTRLRSFTVSWPGAEAVICDSRDPHALSRALHDPTFGTRITAARAATETPAATA